MKNFFKHTFTSAFFTAGILLIFTSIACGNSSSDTEQVLVLARSGDSVGLDPAREIDGESFIPTSEIFEGLVAFKPGTTEIEPALATSWTISDDGLTYVFTLRENVKFHDDSAFNADAVVFNFMRQHDENHPYYQYGPYKYWGFMNFDKIIDDVQALDTYTVQITLTEPNAPFLSSIAMSSFGIVSPTAIETYKEDTTNNPVGTGPFTFVSWIKGDTITLKANENYWRGAPALSQVIFKVIPEPTARALALETGEVDIILYPSPEDISRLEANEELKIYKTPGLNVGYMAFNTQKKPFDNVMVRRAIAYAINKDDIIDAVYGDLGRPAYTAIPPTMWSYTEDLKKYEYNPEKAKALLKEAGYPDGFTLTMWPIPVTRPYMPDGPRVAEIIQAQLSDVGIRATIELLDWGTHLERTDSGLHEVAFLGWTGDNGDPDNFLNTLLSSHTAVKPASNIAYWKNAEFTALIDKASVITNQEERSELYKKAQVIFADQVPWVSIAHSVNTVPKRSYVKGYVLTPIGELQNLRLVRIEK